MTDSKRQSKPPDEAAAPSGPTRTDGDADTTGPAVDDASQATDGDPPPASPERRRRRGEQALDVEYDAQGRERPRFLLSFPKDPELGELVRAYEAGNYAHVRREAPALAERTTDPRVRTAARELRRRIDPDPALRYILLATLALLAVLVYWAYGHSGH